MTSVQERDDTALVPAVDSELAEPVATISRRLWAGTALLAAVLVVAIGWGWFGRWSQHLDATAIVVHGTGPVAVVAPAAGTITTVAVEVGDTVHAGAVLATVATTGHTRDVVANTTGTVLSIAAAGSHVDPTTLVAQLDPVTQQAHAYLLVHDPAALARLAVGQQVTLDSPGGLLDGHVAGLRTTATTSAALSRRLLLPLTHPSQDPVWLVEVDLDAGTPALGQTQAQARVHLPSIRVYRLLIGDGS